jgi:hypothetical protein
MQTIADNGAPGRIQQRLINWAINCNILWLAVICLRNPHTVLKIYRHMTGIRNAIRGGSLTKIYKIAGRFYYSIYSPGWPSKTCNKAIKRELLRQTHPDLPEEKPAFVFLAVTGNPNQQHSFSKDQLLQTVQLYQQQNVLQIHFNIEEPMVRINDLLEVISYASKKSECWVFTSGLHLTAANARLLKKAGCKGIVVNIDHYIAEIHNQFRGHAHSFEMAVQAIAAAKHKGLVTALSVCVTKQFISQHSLMPYVDFARQLGVPFVQVLEPMAASYNKNKDVLLEEIHVQQLERFIEQVNHDPKFINYPTLMYHGFHQRRIGCFPGSRSVYIDSAGDVHACPFYHTTSPA